MTSESSSFREVVGSSDGSDKALERSFTVTSSQSGKVLKWSTTADFGLIIPTGVQWCQSHWSGSTRAVDLVSGRESKDPQVSINLFPSRDTPGLLSCVSDHVQGLSIGHSPDRNRLVQTVAPVFGAAARRLQNVQVDTQKRVFMDYVKFRETGVLDLMSGLVANTSIGFSHKSDEATGTILHT